MLWILCTSGGTSHQFQCEYHTTHQCDYHTTLLGVNVTPKFGVVLVAAISHQFRGDRHTTFLTVQAVRLPLPSHVILPQHQPARPCLVCYHHILFPQLFFISTLLHCTHFIDLHHLDLLTACQSCYGIATGLQLNVARLITSYKTIKDLENNQRCLPASWYGYSHWTLLSSLVTGCSN